MVIRQPVVWLEFTGVFFFIPCNSNAKHHNFWIFFFFFDKYNFLIYKEENIPLVAYFLIQFLVYEDTQLGSMFFYFFIFLPLHVPSPYQAFFHHFNLDVRICLHDTMVWHVLEQGKECMEVVERL